MNSIVLSGSNLVVTLGVVALATAANGSESWLS